MTAEAQQTEEIVFVRRSKAARMAGVSDTTISRWAEKGKVKWKKDEEGRMLIDTSTLDLIQADEIEETETEDGRAVAHLTLVVSQCHRHIEKKEAVIAQLCGRLIELGIARDQATLDTIERLNKANASKDREIDKLTRELRKVEEQAHDELLDTEGFIRNEARKDQLVETVKEAVLSHIGMKKPETKGVVDAVIESAKSPAEPIPE